MSFDEACARGAGDQATAEGEVIPPTQEDVAMPPGEKILKKEKVCLLHKKMWICLQGTILKKEEVCLLQKKKFDMPPGEDTAAESSNVKQQATSASAGEIGESF